MGLFQSSIIQLLGIWVAVSCLSGLMIFLIMKVFDALFSNQSSTDCYHKNIVGLLFFFLLNIAGTFYFHDNSFQQRQAPVNTKVTRNVSDFNSDELVLQIPENMASPEKSEFFNVEFLLKSLGIFWLIGALVFSFKMIGGYFYTRTLIISSQSSIPNEWNHFINHQLEKLKISQRVGVFESYRINSAFTFGFIKPLIVLPIGFFTTLPPEQIEAVLLHELYHIKHKDYLVNILTMALEVVFFYHPVMWWLAKNIRQERENRCDDQVTQIMDKKVYAHALLSMESYRQSLNYAIPFSNKQSNLKMRIMRIFEQKPERNMGLKPFLSLLIMVTFLMSFTFYKMEGSKEELKSEEKTEVKDDLKKTGEPNQFENQPEEKVLFRSENSRLGVVLEMTPSTLIAKSENEQVKLFLDEKLYPLNQKLPYGENQIATMYQMDEGASYHFFSLEYFKSNNREEWDKENEHRNTYVFDRETEFFTFKPAQNKDEKTDKASVKEIKNSGSETIQNQSNIQEIENRPADLSEIKNHGPIQLQFKDRTYQNGDTYNIEILKKLVKKFGSDENTDVEIKIDGKSIANGADVEKALGSREIKNIRIVMPSKSAERGVIEIITNDVKEMQIEEVSADEDEFSGLEEVSVKEHSISIELYFESDKLNYSGEVKFNAEKENVLDALGFFDDDPLFVLNDKIVGSKFQISDINPNNIERINILKDKKAIDKYGEKAKNGVIEIYLKKE